MSEEKDHRIRRCKQCGGSFQVDDPKEDKRRYCKQCLRRMEQPKPGARGGGGRATGMD